MSLVTIIVWQDSPMNNLEWHFCPSILYVWHLREDSFDSPVVININVAGVFWHCRLYLLLIIQVQGGLVGGFQLSINHSLQLMEIATPCIASFRTWDIYSLHTEMKCVQKLKPSNMCFSKILFTRRNYRSARKERGWEGWRKTLLFILSNYFYHLILYEYLSNVELRKILFGIQE